MSNCYIIIEYTENLIKPSDSLLKTVLDRVSALVPKFKTDQNMLILSLTSFTTKQAEQHSKIQSILQFRAIWHILALVNKFSLYPLHGKAINGKAQIFETLRRALLVKISEGTLSQTIFFSLKLKNNPKN